MVTTSGFTHTPVTRFLILASIAASTIVSITENKHLLPIKPTPHLWPYLQFSRLLTFQLAFTSATEALISTALLYQFRVLERIWGSRKYASFVAVVYCVNVVLLPIMCLVLKVSTFGAYNYVPSGLVALVFACLSVWGEEIPRLYRYKVLTGSGAEGSQDAPGVVLSDKSTTYLLAAQLALSQFPYQLMPAAMGWGVGSAWMGELLPGRLGRWRIPAWVIGETAKNKERGQYEGLRRRLEEEGSAADGMRNVSDQQAESRDERSRGFLSSIGNYFTGS